MQTAYELFLRLRGRPRSLCANPTCARTVCTEDELCDECSRCYMCEHDLFPGHVHIPTRRTQALMLQTLERIDTLVVGEVS